MRTARKRWKRLRANDYAQIDVEVRGLVEFINEFDGLCTVSSCGGHEGQAESWVRFSFHSMENLVQVMEALPFLGIQSHFAAGELSTAAIMLTLDIEERKPMATLRLVAHSDLGRAKLVAKVEHALAMGLDASRHLRPSICDSIDSGGSTPRPPFPPSP